MPAPFGPIRPRISPCSSVTRRSIDGLEAAEGLGDLARFKEHGRPPAAVAAPRALPRRSQSRLSQRKHAARLEARDQHDDRAIDHEGEPCALAAEQAVGHFLQRHQDRGADQRPEQQAGAAERGHDQDLHRDQDAEPGLRIDEAEHHGIERAGDAVSPALSMKA